MAGKNTAAFGIYPNRASVDRAVDALRAENFRNTDISVLFPENEGSKEFAHEKNTKAPEGAATGAGAGAVVGGGLGWLAGIGALAIPGLGPFIAAGPIMAALAGAGVGGNSACPSSVNTSSRRGCARESQPNWPEIAPRLAAMPLGGPASTARYCLLPMAKLIGAPSEGAPAKKAQALRPSVV